MAREFDIVVLGAGPAGYAAAICAREAGLRVLLLEARKEIGHGPGETLHPGIEPVFAKLQVREAVVAAGFRRHRGVWKEIEDQNRSFHPYGEDENGEWLGFQVDRRKLNVILSQAAVDSGAEIVRGARPNAILYEGTRVGGVTVGERTLRASWTLDATGTRAWLARSLRLAASVFPITLRGQFGWTKNNVLDLQGQPLFRQHRQGWDWYAPLDDVRAAWVRLRFRDTSVASYQQRAPSGVDLSWRIHRECAGQGYFCLWDAAALLDPASSNGVLRAMMSGILAVDLIKNIVRRNVSEQAAQLHYVKWMGALYDRSVTELQHLYSQSSLVQTKFANSL